MGDGAVKPRQDSWRHGRRVDGNEVKRERKRVVISRGKLLAHTLAQTVDAYSQEETCMPVSAKVGVKQRATRQQECRVGMKVNVG